MLACFRIHSRLSLPIDRTQPRSVQRALKSLASACKKFVDENHNGEEFEIGELNVEYSFESMNKGAAS
jgi:hypothetical protein